MAPLPIIANVYRVAWNWLDVTHGGSAENVMHILATASSASAVAAAVDAAVNHNMLLGLSSYANIESYTVTPLDGSSASVTRTATGINGGGQVDANYAPGQSIVMSFYTTRRGRSYRGRMFLPFVADTIQSEGAISSGNAGTIIAGFETFQGSIAPMELVVASYKTATAAAVTSIACQTGLGSQRRRQTRKRYPGD